MKRKNLFFGSAVLSVCFLFMCLGCNGLKAQTSKTEMFTSTGTTTFTVPAGVTEITIQAWGAGGAGGTATGDKSAAGGGGGGAYAKSTVSVNPGDAFSVTVGAGGVVSTSPNGGTSSVALSTDGTIIVKADGGKGGSNVTSGSSKSNGGAGGSDNIGDVTSNGGNGGDGYQSTFAGFSSQHGGGGGGAAGIYKNGASGSEPYVGGKGGTVNFGATSRQTTSGTGHAYNSSYSGAGANGGFTYKPWMGSTVNNATSASNYGGGGGGASQHSSSVKSSASNGANGAVIITYVQNPCDATSGDIALDEWVCSETDTTVIANNITDATSAVVGTYSWEQAASSDNWSVISGAIAKTYTISETGFYRRGYTVEGCPTVYTSSVEAAKASTFEVGYVNYNGNHDVNSIGVCKNADVDVTLTPSVAISADNIQWQTSTDNTNWTDAATGTSFEYDVTGFTQTVYIRYCKKVSASCIVPCNNVFTVEAYELPVVNSISVPADVCPGQTEYEVVANVPEGADYTFEWGGAADATVTTSAGKVKATSPNCGETYSYSVKAVDEHRCESAEKTGSFTVATPTLAFNALSPMNSQCQDGSYVVPSEENITAYVMSQYAGNCAEGLSVTAISPAPGSTITEATEVTVTVAHSCLPGETKDLAFTLNIVNHTVEITAANNVTTLCGGTETTLTATVTPEDAGGSFAWTKNGEAIASTDNPLTITADATGTFTYAVTYTASTGCTYRSTIDITVNETPVVANITASTPACHEFTVTPVAKAKTTESALSGVKYSWTAPVVSGITGLTAATNQTTVHDAEIDNTNTATTDVVYTVTPTYGTCVGETFTVTVPVKPNIKHHEFTTLNFKNSDIVLYYGACDTVYQYETPEYVTPVTEYQDLLIISHSTLPVPLTPGTYEIIWTFKDPCGNTRTETQTVTVSFPPCGDGFIAEDVDGNQYTTVRIGCECWLAQNLKTTKYSDATEVPVADVFVNDQYPDEAANLAKFGRLYSWYSAVKVAEGDNETLPTTTTCVNDTYVQGVCPEGWGLPEESDYQSMMNILGNAAKVKTTDESAWLPNAAGVAPETFNAFGAGYYDKAADMYVSLLGETYFWTSDKVTSTTSACMCVAHYCPRAIYSDEQNGKGFSVRCMKKETGEAPASVFTCGNSTVTDVDGNTYNTVKIGDQCWMKENLKTTKYADGTVIPQGSTASGTDPYWYYPDDNSDNKATYGLLYNWSAVMQGAESSNAVPSGVQGICPTGWHVPSDAEWTALTTYVSGQSEYQCDGNSNNIAKALASTTDWSSSTTTCAVGNTPANNNATGFSAVPAGLYGGRYASFGDAAYFWSATKGSSGFAYNRYLKHGNASVYRDYYYKNDGFSVRCLKDEAPASVFTCGNSTVTDVDGNTYNTVKIGDQCWMKENLRTSTNTASTGHIYTPTTSDYDVNTYGRLYDWEAVMQGALSSDANPSGVQGICPTGWHVPSDAEWTALTTYVSGQSEYQCDGNSNNIAKALASTTDWSSSTTTCAVGNTPANNNATGFSAVPAGYYSGSYYSFGLTAYFWSATQSLSFNAYYRGLGYNGATVGRSNDSENDGYSVRCVKDAETAPEPVFECGTSTIEDIDGNTYNTVKIGDQCWMKENLKTTKYADGTVIQQGSTASGTDPYWYYPDDNSDNKATYGLLYNWSAVMQGAEFSDGVQGICPTGWHVPSDAEWTALTTYVSGQSEYQCDGNSNNIAKALASSMGWNSDASDCAVGNDPTANNATGFSAVPAGYYASGGYHYFGDNADFWSATQDDSGYACYRYLYYYRATAYRHYSNKYNGYSVRCLRD